MFTRLLAALPAVWLISASAVFAADIVDGSGSTPLLVAAANDDAAQVKQLLKEGADPNVRNTLGTTPLLEAAFHSNSEIIKALLDAGADPNAAGADGQTPLMLVARGTNVAAAKMLLDKGASPRVRESQRQQTALMWAAANSQGPMTRLLVERGADLDAKTATDLMTPLVSAEPRAQPRSPGGMTALMFASREGCLDCVAAMIEKGAAIDLPDPEGVTPLLWAIWNTRFDAAKYLIEHGADVNRWDWWGRTPLYLAVDYVTLPHGGRPDQPSLDETLPIEIVRLLLEKGADPNPQLKMPAPMRATGNDRGLDPMLAPGTTPLIRAAKALEKLKLEGDQAVGLQIIRRAIEEPMRWIAMNAGQEGSIIVSKVKEQKNPDEGFNAATEVYEDLVKAGVIDPAKVVRSALQNASSIASLLLTTEALVSEIPEEKKESGGGGHSHGGPGGMGGMY